MTPINYRATPLEKCLDKTRARACRTIAQRRYKTKWVTAPITYKLIAPDVVPPAGSRPVDKTNPTFSYVMRKDEKSFFNLISSMIVAMMLSQS